MTPEPTKKTGIALTPCLSLPQSSQSQAGGLSVLGVQRFKGADRGIAESEHEGTRAETRTGLSAKRTSPFKSAGGQFSSNAG